MRSIPVTHVAAFTSFARATSKATKKAALFLFSVAVLLAGGAAAVRGQSALDGFDPNANGLIRVVVVQPDGKILIGGDFTTLSPNGGATVSRTRLARLNPDGTLDTAFNPNAPIGSVLAIAVQADGKILAGGDFTTIGGQARNNIARLDATTGLADSFDPNASFRVRSIAVQADGQILVGGDFNGVNSIGGQSRNRIARLDAMTGLADSFNPNAGNVVNAIAVQADGKILIGGGFISVFGASRNRIARLNTDGTLDTAFDPNANSSVNAIAVQADGKILVGGDFNGANSIGGQARNRIARLDATTGLADSFNPNANSNVFAIAVQADGKILACGNLTAIGGQPRNRIARLDATTGLADSFDPNATGGTVFSIAVQADGKILAGGGFTTLAPNGGAAVTRNHIARLETDGRVDQTLNLSAVGSVVYANAIQPDGKILIGGSFTTVLGVTRNNIARLNTDGTLDTAFNPNANGTVTAIAVQADGKILVGGEFNGANSIGGQSRNRIARLNGITGLADSFDPNANNIVLSIAVQTNAKGEILAGGFFTSIGGQSRNRIARLNATTGLADSFNPNANGVVRSIAVQADGNILTGGEFTGANSIGGQARNRIARLNGITGLADSFDPNANNVVHAIALQADGKILVGGSFFLIGGQNRNGIARLDAITGLADLFHPQLGGSVFALAVQADGKFLVGGNFINVLLATRNRIARFEGVSGFLDKFNPDANGIVFSLAVLADGKILAGGAFTSMGGQTRSLFARLSNDSAALQNLAVTQTAITWTRGGSSPQLKNVTFESSTDNVNYTLLGKGTAAGSNWTLTGLSLSTGMNLYIRARGYYRSGYQSGSESLTESVRNAFIAEPTPTPMTIQFSASSYPVDEGSQSVDINITRFGNTTGAASVNFTTSDLAGAQNCNVLTGVASSRCDYETGIRTVQFAAGETSRLVSVFIIDDSYLEGPETFTLSLSNPSGAALGSPATATVNITDNDIATGTNPIGTAGFFVPLHYLDFLNRATDAGGLAFWTNEITSCGANQQCIDIKRINVSAAFFLSIEFQQTGYLVYKANQAAFNSGEQLKLRDFLPDTQEIGRGVIIGQPGAEQQLETNKQNFFRDFVQRTKFLEPGAYPITLTAAQFVDKLNGNTFDPRNPGAGALTQDQRDALVAQLLPDPSSPTLRAQVLRSVSENGLFNQRQFNKAFVLMQYFGYLRRNPNDAPELGLDFAGYNFWLNKLNQFDGNFINAEMVKAFILSGEYIQRFGP